jgi:enoyl-CoA hydratase
LRKPLIAAVEGWCLGAGNELMMCADIAVAGEGAKFAQPETNLGIIPGAGGCAVLTRLVGRTTALRMVLTGEPLSAEAARDAGLISEVVKDGQALEKAKELAAKIAARAPLALQQAKAVIRQTEETPLSAQLAMERQAFSLLLSSHDKDAGIDAFLNKERPDWQGR